MSVRGYVHRYPRSRTGTLDIGSIALEKHNVAALLEADVTDARRKIAAMKRKGAAVSFTSWLIKCVADTAQAAPEVHGLRCGRRGVMRFDQTDIALTVERIVEGEPVPIPFVLRDAGRKSVAEIRAEVLAAKSAPMRHEGDYAPGSGLGRVAMALYYSLPWFVRRIAWRALLGSPRLVQRMMGTVMVTSVGSAGGVSGWVIPRSVHPLCIAVGSIVRKPGLAKGRVAVREYLPLTIIVDHDVIDGMPAARVLSGVLRKLEEGHSLDD
ncbi:MAG: 2-oxo acid dehydrogenase subunit E2 [Spirochaetes bacterium]|nr:2-oxo acid dehydrogenase subunit E2 [Spirochaetota bacterium]